MSHENVVTGVYEGVVKKPVKSRFSFFMPDLWENVPLIIYLHGAGESGSETKEFRGPIHTLCPIEKKQFAILNPICPNGDIWEPDAVVSLVKDYVLKNFPIDKKRIYLTGFSMGGRGVWDCATEYPDMFAAVAALSGFSCYLRAEKMRNVPSWTFHGKEDGVVPFEESWKMVSALKSCGATARFTAFDGVDHGTSFVYLHQEFYDWLLGQKKD